MSILDRLTDEQLKEMLSLKEIEAAGLRVSLRKRTEQMENWRKLANTRSMRIAELTGELAELRRDQGSQENAFADSMKMVASQFGSLPGPQAEFVETLMNATKKCIARLEKEDCHG